MSYLVFPILDELNMCYFLPPLGFSSICFGWTAQSNCWTTQGKKAKNGKTRREMKNNEKWKILKMKKRKSKKETLLNNSQDCGALSLEILPSWSMTMTKRITRISKLWKEEISVSDVVFLAVSGMWRQPTVQSTCSSPERCCSRTTQRTVQRRSPVSIYLVRLGTFRVNNLLFNSIVPLR